MVCATDPQDPFHRQAKSPLATADAVERLRRERRTQEHIAGELGISKATVSRILKRRGLSLLSSLEPQEPRPRYEREKPGEIIHLDIKKLGRFNSIGHRITGRSAGHCQQPRRRLGVRPRRHRRPFPRRHAPTSSPIRKRKAPSPSSLATIAYYKSLGVTVERVMTDNGSLLSIESLRTRLQAARHQAHHDQALHAADQRQGRALHPDRAPRMGLRHRLRALRSAPRRAPALAASLQLA